MAKVLKKRWKWCRLGLHNKRSIAIGTCVSNMMCVQSIPLSTGIDS